MRCKNCGKEILESANFCRFCGTKVLREEVPPAVKTDEPDTPVATEELYVADASAPETPTPEEPAPETPVSEESVPESLKSEASVPGVSTPEAPIPEAAAKVPRNFLKNSITWITAIVTLGILAVIVLVFGKARTQQHSAPEVSGVTLAEQLEQAETWQACYEIGQAYQDKQDYESAIAAFEAALALEGAEDTVRLALAEAYCAVDDYENALREYEALAETGTIPYYEERTQCCVALKQPEKAGQMLHTAYLETGDEAITTLEQKYWNADALHAYGEYVGYDGNFDFGLFDWNHDLTPELAYVYNQNDYGISLGIPIELWTYQNDETVKLYDGFISQQGVGLTADGDICLARTASHGRYDASFLTWDGQSVSVLECLDYYLQEAPLDGSVLHPEYNYYWDGEEEPRVCMIDKEQVTQEQYEAYLAERYDGRESLTTFYPVMHQNCKTYLNYDWDVINGKPESYTIKKRLYTDYRSAENQFGTTFLQTADESNVDYGIYALTRSDTGGIIETFTLPFDDHEMYKSFYIDGEDEFPCTKQTDTCALFELWYGAGMVCNLSFDKAENKLYELSGGSYDIWDDQLIYSSLTYDTDSPKTIEVQTSHGESVCALLNGYARTGYTVKDDCVYVWGWKLSQGASYQEICDMEIWRYTRGDAAPICLATVPAYCIVDANDDSVTYKVEWDGADYTIALSSDPSVAQAPTLTSQTGLDKTLYPRPERTLKAGMCGEDVKYVQALLISMNYDVPKITGGFDEITEGSVIAWQKRHGYEQTGIVDAKTLGLMEEAEVAWLKKQVLNPDFTFTTVDQNGTTRTQALFAEHTITMLNLWANWCGPCVNEMPDLQKLANDYTDKGLYIVGVMAGGEADVTKLSQLGITYLNIFLTEELDAVLSSGYVPTTIFVNSKGHIVGEMYVGSRSYSEWAAIIDEVLG